MKNFLLLLLFLTPMMLSAQVTWTGGGTMMGVWNDGANWSTGMVPGPGDNVILTGDDVTLSVSTTVASVELQSGATLVVDMGVVLEVDGNTNPFTDDNKNNGAIDVSSPSGELTNNGTIVITNSVNDGISARGDFINNGVIMISDIDDDGLTIAEGTFTNNIGAMIDISLLNGGSDSDGLIVDDNSSSEIGGTFQNYGEITIAMDNDDDGIEITDSSVFENDGDITISGGDYTINVREGSNNNPNAVFNNNADGIIIITGSGDDGVVTESTTTFNNAGYLEISDAGTGSVSSSTSDHSFLVDGTFNNLAGGEFKSIRSESDGIRNRATFTNAGTLTFDGFGGDAIENDDVATYTAGSVIEIGCNDDIGEVELKDSHDLGQTVVNFDVTGADNSGSNSNQGDLYDFVENFSQPTAIDITGVTAHLEFAASYTPAVGDCFRIFDGSGSIVGPIGAITSSDPAVSFSEEYGRDGDTELEVCIDQICVAGSGVTFTNDGSEPINVFSIDANGVQTWLGVEIAAGASWVGMGALGDMLVFREVAQQSEVGTFTYGGASGCATTHSIPGFSFLLPCDPGMGGFQSYPVATGVNKKDFTRNTMYNGPFNNELFEDHIGNMIGVNGNYVYLADPATNQVSTYVLSTGKWITTYTATAFTGGSAAGPIASANIVGVANTFRANVLGADGSIDTYSLIDGSLLQDNPQTVFKTGPLDGTTFASANIIGCARNINVITVLEADGTLVEYTIRGVYYGNDFSAASLSGGKMDGSTFTAEAGRIVGINGVGDVMMVSECSVAPPAPQRIDDGSAAIITQPSSNLEEVTFSAFPNPMLDHDVLTINVKHLDLPVSTTITVMDAVGKVWKVQNIDELQNGNFTINMSDLSRGIYFLNIQSGESTTAMKIVR